MMNMRILGLTCLIGFSVSLGAQAQRAEQPQTRQVAPQPTDAAPRAAVSSTRARTVEAAPAHTRVESISNELQGIVVLCATQPNSIEFKNAWVRYVQTRGVTPDKLDALIDDVLERAEAYRAEQSASARADRTTTIGTTRESMHDTAMAVIRKIG